MHSSYSKSLFVKRPKFSIDFSKGDEVNQSDYILRTAYGYFDTIKDYNGMEDEFFDVEWLKNEEGDGTGKWIKSAIGFDDITEKSYFFPSFVI